MTEGLCREVYDFAEIQCEYETFPCVNPSVSLFG